MHWKAVNERNLTYFLLEQVNPSVKVFEEDWRAVAARMGPEFNWNACRYEL
jgi:hypothetical protein